MKTINAVYNEMKAALQAAGIDEAEIDARYMIEHVTGLSYSAFILEGDKRFITLSEEKTLSEYMARRLRHEPVTKIIGERYFWKSNFKVSRETLDPRADSETLIEVALKLAPDSLTVLDCGTGTGCLLLSLLLEWPDAIGAGLDISVDAVAVAEENAQALGLAERTVFHQTDWEDYDPPVLFDLVVSNPPYIALGEEKDLSPEVLLYDPPQALFGGGDGLDAYRSLVKTLPILLKPEKYVILEIGYQQAKQVSSILVAGGFEDIRVWQDLGGRDRVVSARLQTGR